MLLALILFGIAGVIVFHGTPAIVTMCIWYTLFVTVCYICEKNERR